MRDKTWALDNSKAKSESSLVRVWCKPGYVVQPALPQGNAAWSLAPLQQTPWKTLRRKLKVLLRTQKPESKKSVKYVLTDTTPVVLKHSALAH